ncbi:MAG: TonB-dependent receptor [bacterium]|nr:TonB-dependent receptor [bacterium]
MKRSNRWTVLWVCLIASVLLVPQVLAQNPTGTLKGSVTDDSGAGLPGVTVTATSPNLQGERSTQTSINGDYKLAFMPPGEYKCSYELEGFATKIRTVVIPAAQTKVSDIQMQIAEVVEEIIVTSNVETISETNTLAQTTTHAELESLPINRTPLSAVNLAPGVSDTGPSSEPSILGSFSYENLYLINGVEVNENIRGQFLPLFIEDAIQETTTTTAGVSAEYGRFTGGVVNVITKSGGNDFSGSFRVNVDNDDWISDKTDKIFNPDFEQVDDRNEIYEGTFGGPIWKDRIWFFLAGRDRTESSQDTLLVTNISYPTSDEETRFEAKATIALTPSHSLIGSYLEIERTRAGSTFGNVLDLRSLNDRLDPQDITTGNYTGILTSSFFLEAQYSERFYEIATGFGGPPDLIDGTLIRHRPTGRRFWSSTFCGTCEPEIRNNEDYLVKGSYFLTTEGAGSHDLTFGYDNFSDIRFSVNHQSGSDFQVWADDIVVDGSNNIFPVFSGGATWIVWWPPVGLDIAQETDFETRSYYANDSWQLNDKWSFNIGVRYDENDGVDSSGALVSDDSKVSPRLGLSYDVKGDGDLVINASYGTYVAALANTGNVADGASTGGALAGFFSTYGGPTVNTNCAANPGSCVGSDSALNTLFNWYFGAGGTQDVNDILNGLTSPPNLFYSCIPGATAVIRESFVSPSTTEFTVGVTKRLGSKGLMRADLVFREWEDFYSQKNQPGDFATNVNGDILGDVQEIGNFGDDVLERNYTGLLFSSRYRFTDRFTLAGNYTWSESEGNINGETGGSGPVSASPNQYREYSDNSWAFPVGPLSSDQEHKLRVWAVYDILDNERHNLNVSLLGNFFSGTPYSDDFAVDTRPYVTNPGYAQPPANVSYFPTGRGAFDTGDVTRFDVAFNYTFRWNMWGKSFEIFLQPEVINLFDDDAIDARSANDDVSDATDGAACPASPTGSCLPFNPFTTTPVRDVHYVYGDDYGQADEADDFQEPRTFRFSVGFRF